MMSTLSSLMAPVVVVMITAGAISGNKVGIKTTFVFQIEAPVIYPFTMMTSSNGYIFHVTGPLCEEFTSPGEFPAQRLVTRNFDVFFDLCLNNGWVNNRDAGDLRSHRAHYDLTVMTSNYRRWVMHCTGTFSLFHDVHVSTWLCHALFCCEYINSS